MRVPDPSLPPRWVPSSIAARMVVVILLSVLPLGLIAATLAWRNYETMFGRGTDRTEAALLGFIAHQQEALVEAAGDLRALGALPGVGAPRSCPMLAAIALRLSADRVLGLAIRQAGGGGALVCAAGHEVPAPLSDVSSAWLDGASLGLMRRLSSDVDAFPLRVVSGGTDRTGALTLDALVAIERTTAASGTGGGTIWVMDGDRARRAAGDAALVPPDRSVMRQLLARGRPVFSTDRTGRIDAYALGHLPDGSVLVAGDQATGEEQRATSLLFRRVVAIAALLLLGLVVVLVGAHVTVSAPVLALTRRVDLWHEGGAFDRGNMRFMPTELVALAASFAHAVATIAERERRLEEAATAQDLLIKEIHHRVKNNLQIIASLLNLQASRIRAPEAKAEFGAARDRVRALATLHRHLYSEGGLHTIAMRPFLLELCGQLFQAMGEREGTRIRLEVEAPDLDMSSDQAVPLALIVTEAVSNAVKYAFPDGRSGRVAVRLTEEDDRRIVLRIDDDGVGIPAGRAETETGIRDGLGIQLIRGFARQLGATLSVVEQDGTHYVLSLALAGSAADGRERPVSG